MTIEIVNVLIINLMFQLIKRFIPPTSTVSKKTEKYFTEERLVPESNNNEMKKTNRIAMEKSP